MADKLVLVIHFDEITICSLFNALFIRCFKLIYTARVIDCKHRSQWRHQQILHSTVPYGRGIWEKESIIGVQWFQKNPNPRVHRSVGNSASLVSHWNGVPSAWDFSVPTEHQWWILFILPMLSYLGCHVRLTRLCPLARCIYPCLVLVKSRKNRPNITEKLLTGM